MKRALLAGLLSLTLAGAARAQDSDEALKEQLRQHVAKAKVHYDLGEYKEAADEYIVVYRLKPIVAVLFNIAQAYRQGGLYDKARQFYKSYLREGGKNVPNRALIEQNIREMDELIAKEKRAREAAPTGVKEPPEATLPLPTKSAAGTPHHPPAATPAPATPPPAKTAEKHEAPTGAKPAVNVAMAPPWTPTAKPAPAPEAAQTAKAPEAHGHTLAMVIGGAGVALLGGGVAFTMKASSIDGELSARPHPTSVVDDLASQSKSSHTMGALLFAAGAAAAVGAGVLYFAF